MSCPLKGLHFLLLRIAIILSVLNCLCQSHIQLFSPSLFLRSFSKIRRCQEKYSRQTTVENISRWHSRQITWIYVLCDLRKGEVKDNITGSILQFAVVYHLLLTLAVSAPCLHLLSAQGTSCFTYDITTACNKHKTS